MATSSSVFRFRKNITIGALAAEEDSNFLKACFVDTGLLNHLTDLDDYRTIVLGRTGSGKSALFLELARRHGAIVISPDELALDYLSNSELLKTLDGCGISLLPLYKLLWKHIFVVQVLRIRHHQLNDESDARGWFRNFLNSFSKTPQDQTFKEALEYLADFGDSFWQTTDYRITEFIDRASQKIEAEAGTKLKLVNTAAKGHKESSQERKGIIEEIGRDFINSIQIRKLSDVVRWLSTEMNGQRPIYIIIDGLDGAWAETSLRYQLIRALIEITREFKAVSNVKILVALREDLFESVLNATLDAGFQKEKFTQLCLSVRWARDELKDVLETRVNKLIKDQYTTAKVKIDDVMEVNAGQPGVQYLLDRTLLRPRDAIDFFNQCISMTTDNPRITRKVVLDAEPVYSSCRLTAIADEWRAIEPFVMEVARFLSNRKANLRLDDIPQEQIHQFCYDLSLKHWNVNSEIANAAKLHCENRDSMSELSFLRVAMALLYKVGVVGLKLNPAEKITWVSEGPATVDPINLSENVGIKVHKMFWRALNIVGTGQDADN